jgi:hypothetical protein
MALNPPTFHTIARKITKETATQSSASKNILGSLAPLRGVEGRLDGGAIGRAAGQALDRWPRRVGRDAAHVRHGVGGAGTDRGLRLGELAAEIRLERLTALVRLRREGVAGLLRDRLRARAGSARAFSCACEAASDSALRRWASSRSAASRAERASSNLPTFGKATRDIRKYRRPKAIANHRSCDA